MRSPIYMVSYGVKVINVGTFKLFAFCFLACCIYRDIESENHRAMESGRDISALNLLDLQKILLSFSSIVIDNYLLLNVYVNWVSVSVEITKLERCLLFHDIFKSSMMKCQKFLLFWQRKHKVRWKFSKVSLFRIWVSVNVLHC